MLWTLNSKIFLNLTFLPLLPSRSVNENWLLYKDLMLKLIDKYVPLITISNDKTNRWFDKSLHKLYNKKRQLYRNAMRTYSPAAWLKYRSPLKTYCSALSSSKDKYYNNDLPSLLRTNPQKFWQAISSDYGNNISLHDTNQVPLSDHESSLKFNKFFLIGIYVRRSFHSPIRTRPRLHLHGTNWYSCRRHFQSDR